jgi:hypothetical protein
VTDPLVAAIATAAYAGSERSAAAASAVLLVDFLVEAGADAVTALLESPSLETIGRAAAAAHRRDLDDLHWPSLTHPGSVVWPAVLAGVSAGVAGRRAQRAAAIGYEAMVAIAGVVAAAGITRWHRTALAGHAGAAAAAAAVRGDDGARCAEAMALALTMAGGVAQTMLERSPAGAFHRACAAHNGAAAVEFSSSGMAAPRGVLSGPAGLIAACGGSLPSSGDGRGEPSVAAIDETTLRIYPTTGFAQSAVEATCRARERLGGGDATLVVAVHPFVAAQFADPPANRHWDLLTAVRIAWMSGDGWTVDRMEPDAQVVGVELVADGAVAIGDARVDASLGAAAVTAEVAADFARPTVDAALALEKWARHGVADPEGQLAAVRAWLDSDDAAGELFGEPFSVAVSAAGAPGSDRRRRR